MKNIPKFASRLLVLGILWLVSVFFLLMANPIYAYEHDLRVSGILASPNPLECPSEISTQLLVKGTDDDTIENGDVQIAISSQLNGGSWQNVGEILVTRNELDIPFRKDAVWPNDFTSQPNNSIQFRPMMQGTYRFKGQVKYSLDQNSSNDFRESSSYSVNSVCWVPPTIPCTLGWDMRSRIGKIYCPGRQPPPDLCKKYPQLCPFNDICKRFPKLCPSYDICEKIPELCPTLSTPFCQLHPELCPYIGDIEVLFNDQFQSLGLSMLDENNRVVSSVEKLKKPIRDGNRLYTKRMTFFKEAAHRYNFRVLPGGVTTEGKKLPGYFKINPLKEKR